jgi:protein-disulfide isomerase
MVVLLLAAAALTAVTCNKGSPPQEPGKPAEAAQAAPATGAPGAPGPAAKPEQGPADGERARLIIGGIPGLDFTSLSPAAQRELANVFTDEFCYCGCPHTLGACLKTHASCKHAKRMALLAAPEAQAGVAATEIILELGKYYRAFREGRATVKVDDRMCKGAADAKVTLVEYSDFECPYCGQAAPMLSQLAKDLGAKGLRVCYAPFPLQGHPNAMPAAQAALFARDRGKFWEMHDLLFQNQHSLSIAAIKQLADKIGLSGAELGKAFDEKKYVEELNTWKESGRVAGVDSTPSLYFNGRKFNLPMNPETLAHSTDDELEWVAGKNAWVAD